MRSTMAIKKEGLECLIKTLGDVETEVFISSLIRESFDYTEWQREYFDKYSLDEFLGKAAEFDKRQPINVN
ncbi:MAG: hypothetical protein LBB36_02610 [Fibromonadaceae bacterium]|nr:hypothetical protein [Fibromonadaceae bacterium]